MHINAYLLLIIYQLQTTTMPQPSFNRNLEVVRSKFPPKQTTKLLQIAAMANWAETLPNICKELESLSQEEVGDKYVWMLSNNPAYFIQYQIDSYAILKGFGKVILVWKPKFIEYPVVVRLEEFGQNPKIIKSMSISKQENHGHMSEELSARVSEHLQRFYGKYYFSSQQQQFQTKLVTELKHYVSRISKASYWHCVMDAHGAVDVSTRGNLYLRIRVRGVREKYDKDLILFSKKGEKTFMLRGKWMQVISFLAMLLIFVAIIQCPEGDHEGICQYKNEMMMLGAAMMMGLMGMRVAGRNKNKKKMEQQIKKSVKK